MADVRERGVVTVPHGDDEVGAHEHHDLAGLDDLAGGGHRLVRHVVDGPQHQEQHVVVAFQLRPLVGVDGVLDHQFVQPERLGHALHLPLVGGEQPDPHESFTPCADLGHRGLVRVLAGKPRAVDIHTTVDDGARGRDADPGARVLVTAALILVAAALGERGHRRHGPLPSPSSRKRCW